MQVFDRALDEGLLVRMSGECISLAPPFVSTDTEVKDLIEGVRRSLRAVAAG